MRQLKVIFIGFFLIFFNVNAMAGSGHSHGPVTQSVAEAKAEQVVQSLVSRNVVEESWALREVNSMERTKRKGDWVWKAVFANDQATDSAKQTLYVFLSLTGNFIDANYSGQ